MVYLGVMIYLAQKKICCADIAETELGDIRCFSAKALSVRDDNSYHEAYDSQIANNIITRLASSGSQEAIVMWNL